MQTPDRSLTYRPDIDGLRAIAVLSVVIYHLRIPLRGGYVGVDIFFTISGFLIGSIILRETAAGTFTFRRFYERRIRRIFPALFAMLIACTAAAFIYLFPLEMIDYAKSLATASVSVSNLYFWSQSGYFDAASSARPLLHTWSLAVEEQFYIVFPILIVLLRRYFPRRVELAIYILALGSFVLSAWQVFVFPATTFYWAHTRAWELLLGTIVATDTIRLRSAWARNIIGIAGLLLIFGTLLFYKEWFPFPGLAALPPCLGTAMVIAAGRSGKNVAGTLLSFKPLVFVGLISYSFYLWHWPVIVFNKMGMTFINGLSVHKHEALLFSISFVLAVLSWRFVETPFRATLFKKNPRGLFAAAAVAVVAAVAVSATLFVGKGLPSRFPVEAQKIVGYMDIDSTTQYRDGTCFISKGSARVSDFAAAQCLAADPGKRTFLLLGDSHMADMWWGFHKVFSSDNILQVTASGCKPVLHQRLRTSATCGALMSYALTDYLPKHPVDAVIIQASWTSNDLPSLGETLAWLKDHHIPVILLGPVVAYDTTLPRLLALSITHNDPGLPADHRDRSVEPLDKQMAALAASTGHTPYVSMYDLLCTQSSCVEYAAPGTPLQADAAHFTPEGAVLAVQKLQNLHVLPE